MRAVIALLLLSVASSVGAQDATQDVRLRVVQNEATVGGSLVVSVEVRTVGRAPNHTLGSATFDIDYEESELSEPTFEIGEELVYPAFPIPEYTFTFSPTLASPSNPSQARISINGINSGLPDNEGAQIGETFVSIGTLTFQKTAAGVESVTLEVVRGSLSVGYYDTGTSNPIEDNTGTVGDDVVAVATVQDLSMRTVSYGSEDWHLVGAPGVGATVDGLIGPIFTQGFPGSDAGERGTLNVAFWNETTGSYDAPTGPSAAVPAGVGLAVYAFPDEDSDGNDDPYPKTSRMTVDPVNDNPSPVNNAGFGPNPYQADLPFRFPVTYTSDTGVPQGDGWNLLSNPADSTVTWDDPAWTRTNLTDVFYTYDSAADDYVSWSANTGGTRADGAIEPTTGFWARTTGTPAALVMPASAYNPGGAGLREATALPPAIRLRVTGELDGRTRATETLVAFDEGAEEGLDRRDGVELAGLTGHRLQLYSWAGDEALDVDVRPSLADGPYEIGVDAQAIAGASEAATELELTWPEVRGFEDGVPVQLLDTQTGTILDLRTPGTYAFSTAAAPQAREARDGLALPVLRTLSAHDARRSEGPRFVLFVGIEAGSVAAETDGDAEFALAPPSPNPSRGAAQIRFTLATTGPARVAVYDVLGREVAVLHDATLPAGRHDVPLASGTLAPGVYVVRLVTPAGALARSLTIVR